MKFWSSSAAVLAVVALCAFASPATAFAPSGCFIVPSIQHSASDLISRLTASSTFVGMPGGARTPEHQACVFYGRGLLYEMQGDNAHAISDFNRAIGWMSSYGDAYAARADAEEDVGQHDAAMKDYAAAAANPDHAPARLAERCWIRALRGRPLALALEDCQQSLALGPKSSTALTARGLAYLRMANYAAATADCNAALALDARNGSALFIRGIAELRTGDTQAGNVDLVAANSASNRIAEAYAIYGVKP